MLYRAFRIDGQFTDILDTTEAEEFTQSLASPVRHLSVAEAFEVGLEDVEVVIASTSPLTGTLLTQPDVDELAARE